MRNKKKIVAIFVGVILILAAKAGAVNIPNCPFVIDAPSGWNVNAGGIMGSLIAILDAPREGFAANITVVAEGVGDTELNEYTKLSIENADKMITGFKLLDQQKVNIQGMPFTAVEYTGVMGKFNLHWVAVFTIYKSKAYIFTGTSVEQYASEYIPIFLQSFKTIRLAGGAATPTPPTAPPPPIEGPPPGGEKDK